MKKKLFICLVVFSLGLLWVEGATKLYSEGFESNERCVAEILDMENAVAFMGRSDAHPYANANYTILFKDENSQYTVRMFRTKQTDAQGKLKNLEFVVNTRMPSIAYEYNISQVDADIIIDTFAKQLALAEKNNEPKAQKSIFELGLKVGEQWHFAGRCVLDLDRFCMARKVYNLFHFSSKYDLVHTIKSLVYDYDPISRNSFKDTLMNFDCEAGRQYFGSMDFSKGETISTFGISSKEEQVHIKVMTLNNKFNLRRGDSIKFPDRDMQYTSSLMRWKDGEPKGYFGGAGGYLKWEDLGDYSFLFENLGYWASRDSEHFGSLVQMRVKEEWGRSASGFAKGSPICFEADKLTGAKLSLFGGETKAVIELIDRKINPPIARFKGASNGEFAECVGLASIKDDEFVDFFSFHFNEGHNSVNVIIDGASDEKLVFDVELDFSGKDREYKNFRFNVKDQSKTVSYAKEGEVFEALSFNASSMKLNKKVSILRSYRAEDGTIRVIFAGKIIP